MEHEASFLSAFLGLIFVLGLIFLITYLFKRFGPSLITGTPGNTGKKEIVVLDAKAVDPKNRLVLIRCKNKEYLLLTGQSNVLIDSFVSAQNNTADHCEVCHVDV